MLDKVNHIEPGEMHHLDIRVLLLERGKTDRDKRDALLLQKLLNQYRHMKDKIRVIKSVADQLEA